MPNPPMQTIQRTDLRAVSNEDLVRELQRRGAVVSVWTASDLEYLNEDEKVEHLSDDQLLDLKHELLQRSSLADTLGAAGNEHLSTLWSQVGTELIAEQERKAAPPSPSMR